MGFHVYCTAMYLLHTKPNIFLFCFFLSCCSFHETEEDGPERLHSTASHKRLRMQAVSTIWLMLFVHSSNSKHCGSWAYALILEKLFWWMIQYVFHYTVVSIWDEITVNTFLLGRVVLLHLIWVKHVFSFYFQSWGPVYSEPEYCTGCRAHERKPLSSCKLTIDSVCVCMCTSGHMLREAVTLLQLVYVLCHALFNISWSFS